MSNQQSIEQDGDLKVNIRSFQSYLDVETPPATVRTYIEAANLFDEFIRAHGYPRYLADIRAEHVEPLITTQLNIDATVTAASGYRSLQLFIRWAPAEGEIAEENDLFRNLKFPIALEKIVCIVPENEMNKLMRAGTGTGFNKRRDLADLTSFKNQIF